MNIRRVIRRLRAKGKRRLYSAKSILGASLAISLLFASGCGPTAHYSGPERAPDELARVGLKPWVGLRYVEPISEIEGFEERPHVYAHENLGDQVFLPGQYRLETRVELGIHLEKSEKLMLLALLFPLVGIADELAQTREAILKDKSGVMPVSVCHPETVEVSLVAGHSYLINGSSEDEGCWLWVTDLDTNSVVAGALPQ